MFTEYVAGFMFDKHDSLVVLIKKNKPDWQKGKLNGVGGKIEESDASPFDAMAREFAEETGVITSPAAWRKLAVLNVPDARIHFFYTHIETDFLTPLQQLTDEEVQWQAIDDVVGSGCVLPNLSWLIPMALDPARPFAIVSQA